MLRLAALLVALALATPAQSQDKTVKIVLGFPAGATSDLLSRLVADHMRQAIGQKSPKVALPKEVIVSSMSGRPQAFSTVIGPNMAPRAAVAGWPAGTRTALAASVGSS